MTEGERVMRWARYLTQKCESGDGMRSCKLEIAPQRSVMVMAEDKRGARNALIGCYYFCEK